MYCQQSQAVNFWAVHEFVAERMNGIVFPMLGTPAWCALPDDDPAKLAAVLDGGQHHALRLELGQAALADASRAIAAAADWRGIAAEITQRRAFRAANPWAVRQAAS